jgi:hypothetical protein
MGWGRGRGKLGMFNIDDFVKNKQIKFVCKIINSEMHSRSIYREKNQLQIYYRISVTSVYLTNSMSASHCWLFCIQTHVWKTRNFTFKGKTSMLKVFWKHIRDLKLKWGVPKKYRKKRWTILIWFGNLFLNILVY